MSFLLGLLSIIFKLFKAQALLNNYYAKQTYRP
jgi:hypothetical protein